MINNFCSVLFDRLRFSEHLGFTYTIVCCLNAVFSISAFIGNLLILIAVKRKSSLIRRPSYLLLYNLAISDFGVGALAQPLYVAFRVAGMQGSYQLHCHLGIAYNLVTICLAWLSLLTITCICIDRFLAVHLHSKYREIISIRRVKLVITALWLVAGFVDLAFAISVAVYWIVINVLISISVGLTSVSYITIYRTLHRHQVQIHDGFRSQELLPNEPGNKLSVLQIARLKKTVNSMLCVYGVFLACYVPYFFLAIVINATGRNTVVHGANQILITLIFINSSLNPITLYCRMPEIRQSAGEIFHKFTYRN